MKEGLEALGVVADFVSFAALAATASALVTVGSTTPGTIVLMNIALATNLVAIYLSTQPFLLDNNSLELRITPAKLKAGSSNGMMTAHVRRVSPANGLGVVTDIVLTTPRVSGAMTRGTEEAIQAFARANRQLLAWMNAPGVRAALAEYGAEAFADELSDLVREVDEALRVSEPFTEQTTLTFEGLHPSPHSAYTLGGSERQPNRAVAVVDEPTSLLIDINATMSSSVSGCGATTARRDHTAGINGFRIDDSFPPVITRLDFPTVISKKYGSETWGRVEFRDREGDVIQMEQTTANDFGVYALNVRGVKEGSVPIGVVCPSRNSPADGRDCGPGPWLLRATLVDADGNRSKPAEMLFTMQ